MPARCHQRWSPAPIGRSLHGCRLPPSRHPTSHTGGHSSRAQARLESCPVSSAPVHTGAARRGASPVPDRPRRRRHRRRGARGHWRAAMPERTLLAWKPERTQRSVPESSVHTWTRSRLSLPSRRRGNACSAVADTTGRSGARWPIIERNTGRANNSKLTCDDTGLPGRPKIGTRTAPRCTDANASGLAGLIATCDHS